MKTVPGVLLCFFLAATIQNLVLTTGFGASVLLKVVRRPKHLRLFFLLLLLFSVTTAALFYPLDLLLPSASWVARMLRPLCIIVLTCALYFAATALAKRFFREQYRHVRYLLPLAMFNTIVAGVALVINHQVSVSFGAALAIAAGGCVGFFLLSTMTAEAVERLDNPDIPAAFRGLPAILLYLGLLALALMGFSPLLNFT